MSHIAFVREKITELYAWWSACGCEVPAGSVLGEIAAIVPRSLPQFPNAAARDRFDRQLMTKLQDGVDDCMQLLLVTWPAAVRLYGRERAWEFLLTETDSLSSVPAILDPEFDWLK